MTEAFCDVQLAAARHRIVKLEIFHKVTVHGLRPCALAPYLMRYHYPFHEMHTL